MPYVRRRSGLLQALPLHGNGKIVLREHEAKDNEEVADEPKQRPDNGRGQTRTGDRDRQHTRR